MKIFLTMYFVLLLLQMIISQFYSNKNSFSSVRHDFHRVQTTHSYVLTFEHGLLSPDGFVQEGILVNGIFPGPALRVKTNEILNVKVVNKLNRGLAIHFHGIHQVGTVSSDGVPGVTQQEIPPNGTYRYSMEIGDQMGTYMYHAHTGLDQNWAMGMLIIEDPPDMLSSDPRYLYQYEESFLLSQCWHKPMQEIANGILGVPFEDVPDAESLLINGRSYADWINQTHHKPKKQEGEGFRVIRVKPGATYRFRVVGLGVDSMLNFRISNHSRLKVIEMDGIYTEPVETDHLEVNSAQRFSVLAKMDQPIGNYWIKTEMIPGPGPANGRAILHYEGAPNPTSMTTQVFEGETAELVLTRWIQSELYPSASLSQPLVFPIPQAVDREIVIRSQEVNLSGRTKFSINGKLHEDFYPPLLHQIRAGRNLSNSEPPIFEIRVGDRIQIVFVNTVSDDGECEQHPWHFHGHSVSIVGEGPDDYASHAKAIIDANIKLNRNQFRDVVTVFANQTSETNISRTPCGWTAVRFVANNPGIWMVHCHLSAHMLMGKLFLLYEHTEQDPMLTEVT